MYIINRETFRALKPGYSTNALVAPISSFATIGKAVPGSNIVNLPHLQYEHDIITSAIVTPILPRQFGNQSETLGEAGAVYGNFRLKVFLPGDGPDYMHMVNSLINEPLLVLMEDAELNGYYIQLGSAERPVYFSKSSFRSGTQSEGIKGFEVEAIATAKYFYNQNPSIKEIFISQASAKGLPVEVDDISETGYNTVHDVVRAKAKLLLLPLAYTSGAVYAIDRFFTPVAIPYSRSTNGTRINSAGFVEVMEPDMPRMNYNIADGSCAYLCEGAATNRILNSVALSGTTIASGVTTSGIPSIYAPATVKKLDAGGTLRYDFNGITMGYYSASWFVKSDSANQLTFQFSASATGLDSLSKNFGLFITYNFGTEVLGYGLANGSTDLTWLRHISVRKVSCANGWVRLIATMEVYNVLSIALLSTRLQSVTAGFIYATCPQFEAGVGSSYIPTTGAAATRLADSFSFEGLDEYQGEHEGGFFLDLSEARGEIGNTIGTIDPLPGEDETTDYHALVLNQEAYIYGYRVADLEDDVTVASPGHLLRIATQYGDGQLKQFSQGANEVDAVYDGETTLSHIELNPTAAAAKLACFAAFNGPLLNSELISITST